MPTLTLAQPNELDAELQPAGSIERSATNPLAKLVSSVVNVTVTGLVVLPVTAATVVGLALKITLSLVVVWYGMPTDPVLDWPALFKYA